MESSNKGLLFVDNDDCRDRNNWYNLQGGEKESTGFSQPEDYEDENGAGGELGKRDNDYENDNPGGAGSAGSAANNEEDK